MSLMYQLGGYAVRLDAVSAVGPIRGNEEAEWSFDLFVDGQMISVTFEPKTAEQMRDNLLKAIERRGLPPVALPAGTARML
ncbi:hypothetical protein [Montanilutibacter psychrotolerans]|uniref:Uncharacterized protein n=1 Tax=Montanilutibacter psychrotolerans TaxID=1327343 RepID=A0A3M8SPW3_9GAMM|nr:hypothetical protein [Lysobacter psychrotolerans]RNF83309.1 hypothetical protein EER27_12515 [Lysobacter psychrotolerans]